MILIDGSIGSGGGQMLRTAVGLSAGTGAAVRMINIRAGRKNPGMKEQHLQAVLAVNDFCNGSLEGASVGSSELSFRPGRSFRQTLRLRIRTAGSVGLVIQALSIAACGRHLSVEIEGGATFGLWAPPIHYITCVLAPILRRMNYHVSINVKREGFFPIGGASVSVSFSGAADKPLILTERGAIRRIGGISIESFSLRKREVARRQAASASRWLSKNFHDVEIQEKSCESVCAGSGIVLWAEAENSILGGSCIGQLRKSAEDVGKEAAKDLLENLKAGAVDKYASDQLLPFLAMSSGKISTSEITDHARTNAYVIEQFLRARISIRDKTISVSKPDNSA